MIFCVIVLLDKLCRVSLYMEHILVCYEIFKWEYSHTFCDHIEPSICVTNMGHGPPSLWGMGCFLSKFLLPQPQDQCENVVPQGTCPTCLGCPKCSSFRLHNCQVMVLIMCHAINMPCVNIGHNASTWFLGLWNLYYIWYVSFHTPSLDIHNTSQCKVGPLSLGCRIELHQPQFPLNWHISCPFL